MSPKKALGQGQAAIWSVRLGLAWLAFVAPFAVIAAVFILNSKLVDITSFFLLNGDLGMLLASALFFVLIALPSMQLGAGADQRVAALVDRHGLKLCLGMALAAGAAAFVGWRLVYQAYPLSMDEFWASFDASIFQRGRLLAEIPSEWRPYVPALQPLWAMQTPGHQYWASTYLPMNAAFRAVFGWLGSGAMAGPFWAAVSIMTVYAVARELWPQRRDAAFVSTALLATSSQVLVAAMSPYAMPAHLALNLVWLWLFLRKGAVWRGLSLVVAFVASGLHQVIFHPLFAAPFVLQLWLTKRWRLAGFYTVAYAAICLFWMSYWALMLRAHGLAPAAAEAHGAGDFMRRAFALLRWPSPWSVGQMAENLLRFAAWQNPLAIALAVAAAPAIVAVRRGPLKPLLGGIVLTVVAVILMVPFQGHGWGYRYLHGLIGSLCLLAGFGWTFLVKPGDTLVARRAWAALAIMGAFSLLLALPFKAHQAFDFIRPYARAHQAIASSKADVVIVDPTGSWYGADLVRNDPFLGRGPKVMNLEFLTPDQIRTLCSRYKVALFDRRDGARFGISRVNMVGPPQPGETRALLGTLACGGHIIDESR